MNNKVIHILEIFWLIVAILSLGAGIHQSFSESLHRSWLFFLIAFLGFFMFLLRRNLRKKANKS